MKGPWLSVASCYVAIGVSCYGAIQGNGLAFAGWMGIAFVLTVCIVHHQLEDRRP